MCVRVYTDLYILSSFSLEPRCSLVYPRRNVEFKRITETRRRGEEAKTTFTLSFLRFVLLACPPATYLSRSHSSILSSTLASFASYPLSLPPPGTANQSYVRRDIHTLTHIRIRAQDRSRVLALHMRREKEREKAPATSPLLIIHLLGTSATICLLCKSRLTGADVDRRRQRRRVTAPDRLRVDGEYLSLMHSAARG